MDSKVQADFAIKNLKEFINVEKQFIQKEHQLSSQLIKMDDIISHLIDDNPDDTNDEMGIYLKIRDKIEKIMDLVESDRLKDLNFDKEEELFLQKIEEDLKNKNWRLVKRDIDSDIESEDSMLRLDIEEISIIYNEFKELVKIFDGSPGDAKYYTILMNFAKAYEKILLDLYEKEKVILQNLKL